MCFVYRACIDIKNECICGFRIAKYYIHHLGLYSAFALRFWLIPEQTGTYSLAPGHEIDSLMNSD